MLTANFEYFTRVIGLGLPTAYRREDLRIGQISRSCKTFFLVKIFRLY